MICATDLEMIQESVEKLEGVSVCKVGKAKATSSLSITYDPRAVKVLDLYGAIEGTASCDNPDEKPYKVKLN